MQSLVVLGAGGFAREVAWLVGSLNDVAPTWELLGFLDDAVERHGQVLNGTPVLGGIEWLADHSEVYAVCAVGNPRVRKQLVERAARFGTRFATLIDPSVRHSRFVEIGEGSILCAGTILTTNIQIGRHVIFNLDCTVGHDAVIGDFCTVLPSVNVSGNVTIGEGCNVGTGAAIINDVAVGAWTVLGAGAVAVRDLPAGCTAVGVPARVIKSA